MAHVCIAAPEGVRVERAWQAHDLECWAVGWASHPDEPMKLYTGADDATLKAWDLRCDPEDGPAATASNRRAHGAGVCCISASPHRPERLALGLADGGCCVWDLGAPAPVCRLRGTPADDRHFPPPSLRKGFVEKGGKGSTIKTPRKHSSGKQETPGWGSC